MKTRQLMVILWGMLIGGFIDAAAASGDTNYAKTQRSAGATFANESGTITWNVGNETSATIPENVSNAVSNSSVSVGTDLSTSQNTYFSIPMVQYRPAISKAGNTEGVMIEYRVKTAKGVTFKPTNVTFAAVKVGTDAATFSYSYTADGEEKGITAVDASTVRRNDGRNTATTEVNHSVDITEDGVGTFTFRVYISNTAKDKDIAIGHVAITGTFNGTVENVARHTLSVQSLPATGGQTAANPNDNAYDEGAEVTLTATPDFGYHFVNWTDAAGNEVSKDMKFTYTVNADASLTANFKAVNTYELAYNVSGGANLYMVQPTPAPTVVNGRNMYEEGTKVTLTASGNKILTFTNWSDGTSNSSLSITMDGDKSVTANYSAADFIAGWDFHKAGNNGRKADFFAELNDAAALDLVNGEGKTTGWLDKSTEAAGGYEGRPAAVNWAKGSENGDVGHYFWKTMVNAANFSNIKVTFEMLYNFNSYTTYDVEYSLDNATWTKAGSVTMEGAKIWTAAEIALPADADNKEKVFIRWTADKTSPIMGAAHLSDGISIANIFILGEQRIAYDPTAPTVVSTVPVEGADNSSATGKIVISFDKRVKTADGAAATLNGKSLVPTVSGKTVTFDYKGLAYATDYTFSMPAAAITNMSGIPMASPVTIHFTTMSRPELEKALYDFVVPTDGTLETAIAAANKRTDKNKRYRIFVLKGNYKLPQSTTETINGGDGKTYPSPITKLSAANVSIIGEDMDATTVTNTITNELYNNGYGQASVYERIGYSDVLQIQSQASDTYLQDITIKSGIGDNLGRNIAIHDMGTKTIYKNVCLYGYQDTWVSNNNNGLYYFEGGNLRGRTDFLCGKGDAYFNGVSLVMCEKGGYLAVPSQSLKYGYVFKGCEITGETADVDGNYMLGRPWGDGTPAAYFIDTKMTAKPSSSGWTEMDSHWPKRLAEWNSMTSTGTQIDLSARKTVFADTHTNNPALTEAEAAEISDMNNMFGEWQPTLHSEQATMPTGVELDKTTKQLAWDDSNYVLCWAVCKDGNVISFTTTPAYTVDDGDAKWSVRAANGMGGLGEAATATVASGIHETVGETGEVVSIEFYNLQGVRVNANYHGVVIKVSTMQDGSKKTAKVLR